MELLARLGDWWAKGAFGGGLTREDWRRINRKHAAFQDKMIAEYEMHLANEEMCFPGDPGWFDVCEEVGDGHHHLVPAGVSAEAMQED